MKKTIDYFLYVVQSLEALPAPVTEIVGKTDFGARTILVVPPQSYPIIHQYRVFSSTYGERTTPERTLVFGEDRLLVIEREADIRQIVIPFEALVSVEVAAVLLYAYVKFTWRQGEKLETLKIEYNAVGESFIRTEVQRLRLTKPCRDRTEPDQSDAILRGLPFKFRNYLRRAVYAGEQIFSAVFQPAVGFPRRSLRPRLSGDRTVALTSAGLTVLEDEADRILNYSMITRYFPLSSIERVEFEPLGDFTRMRLCMIDRNVLIPLSGENARRVFAAFQRFLPFIPAAMPVEAPAGVSQPPQSDGVLTALW